MFFPRRRVASEGARIRVCAYPFPLETDTRQLETDTRQLETDTRQSAQSAEGDVTASPETTR